MDGHAHFELTKVQLIAQLSNLSKNMRDCATMADQFAQIVQHVPFGQGGAAVPMPIVATTPTGRKRKTANGEDGEGKDGRKKKAKRDPDLPKRPASAYLFFQNEVRGQLKLAHPFTPHHELLALISKQWASMNESEKKVYADRQKAAKVQYDVAKAAYDVSHGIEPKKLKSPIAAPETPVEVEAPAAIAPGSSAESSEEASEDDSEPASSAGSDDEEELVPATKKGKKVVALPSKVEPPKAKKEKKVKA